MLDLIKTYKNFPKKGIDFKDLNPVYATKNNLSELVDIACDKMNNVINSGKNYTSELIFFGIEARGFILGAALAHYEFSSFIPIRKKGKLPGKVINQKYNLEYGVDEIEVQKIDLKDKIAVIVDDVYATGGTMNAAIKLVKKLGSKQIIPLVIYDIGISKRIKDMIVLLEDEK